MSPFDLLKSAIIVGSTVGVVVAGVMIYRTVATPSSITSESKSTVLGATQKIQQAVQGKEEEHTNKIFKFIKEKVIPAITDSPILAPLLKTTKEVNATVETIKSLPTDQREAVCKQVCGP